MALFASLVHKIVSPSEQGSSGITESSGFIFGALWFVVLGKIRSYQGSKNNLENIFTRDCSPGSAGMPGRDSNHSINEFYIKSEVKRLINGYIFS